MTYRGRTTNFRKPTRTKAMQKINLMNCILHRERFTDADIASLAAGYGHSEAEVRAMIAEEMQRRAARYQGAVNGAA